MADISNINANVQLNIQTKPVLSSNANTEKVKKQEITTAAVSERKSEVKADKANVSLYGDTVEISKKSAIVESKDGKVVAKTPVNRNSQNDNSVARRENLRVLEQAKSTEAEEKKPSVEEKPAVIEEKKPLVEDKKPVIEEKEPAEVTSLAGYTKSQVQQLYRQGRISYNDYQKNLEQKEALLDEMKNDNKEISKKIVAYDQLMSDLTGRLPEDIQAVI